MASIKLMLNRERTLNSGKYPLVFQIIHKRKKKLIYTPYKLFENEYDQTTQKVRYSKSQGNLSSKEVLSLNSHLSQERQRIEKIVLNLKQITKDYSVKDIHDGYDYQCKSYKLLHYMDFLINQKKQINKNGISEAYKSTRSSLAKFIGNTDIAAHEITPRFVSEYENFLRTRHLTGNTIAFYMRNLRTIYNRMINDGFVPRCENPFKSIKISPAKTVKRALEKVTMKHLAEMTFDDSKRSLELSRDLFLFSFYTRGMAFVDICYLRYDDIRDGVISYQRQKTKQPIYVGITTQLQSIIDNYYDEARGFVMPVLNVELSQSLYRQYRSALARNIRHLKIIGERLKLKSPLTTYVARHSWATIAKKQGIAMTVISEGLGHTSEKTTRIYLKELDRSTLDKANEAVIKL